MVFAVSWPLRDQTMMGESTLVSSAVLNIVDPSIAQPDTHIDLGSMKLSTCTFHSDEANQVYI